MTSRLSPDEQHAFTRARDKARKHEPVNPAIVSTLIETIARLTRELRETEREKVEVAA